MQRLCCAGLCALVVWFSFIGPLMQLQHPTDTAGHQYLLSRHFITVYTVCFYNLAPSNISVLNSARLIIIIILLPFVLLSKSIHGPLAREYWILDRCFLEDCNSQLLVSECILAFVNFPIPHQTFCCSPPPLRPAPPFQDLELNTFCLTRSSASWSTSYACHEFIQEDVKVVTSKTYHSYFFWNCRQIKMKLQQTHQPFLYSFAN